MPLRWALNPLWFISLRRKKEYIKLFYLRDLLDNDDRDMKRMIGVYLTLPFVLAIPPILAWYIGHWLDEKFGTKPYLMYFFLILGFVSGFREFFRIVKRFGNED